MLSIENSEHGDIRISTSIIGKIILAEIAKCDGKVIVTNRKGKLPNRFQQLGGVDDIDNMEITMDEKGLSIRIYVLLRFGTSISATKSKLIMSISESLKRVVGIEPNSVVVVVSGMSLGKSKPKMDIEIKE